MKEERKKEKKIHTLLITSSWWLKQVIVVTLIPQKSKIRGLHDVLTKVLRFSTFLPFQNKCCHATLFKEQGGKMTDISGS